MVKKRITAVFVAMMFCLSGVTVFAEDAVEPVESGSAEAELVPQEDKPNSWRYENGVPVEGDETTENLTEESDGSVVYDIESFDALGASPYHANATLKGVDVSAWQETINWDKVKAAGIDFAIIRCGYGNNQTNQDDKQFLRNAKECERLGIPYGVYIYSYAKNTTMASSEADHVLRLLNGRSPSMPVYFDMEDHSTIGSNYAAIAKTFCNKIENAGYPVGVYANLNWWNNYLTDPCFNNWYKWVAQYYTECQYGGEYAMWQYTSSGRVNGISGNVDMNYLIGYPDNHGFHTTVDEPIAMDTTNINNALGNQISTRAWGATRYETSIAAANLLKKSFDVTKFDEIVVAYGGNYPDALAGSYLAKQKKAPIYLVDRSNEGKIRNEIAASLNSGGKVYILGGTSAVSSSFQSSLNRANISTVRLGGNTRYDTNLSILKTAGAPTGEDILICTGTGYADSLSASATGKPIMIVGNRLTSSQKTYLSQLQPENIYLIGGMRVVSRQVAADCSKYSSSVIRIAGNDRYKTSVNVARSFFTADNQGAVLAYGQNFPDGLSGSSVANAMGAPIILTSNGSYRDAVAYGNERNVNRGVVLGGSGLISDSVKNRIIN